MLFPWISGTICVSPQRNAANICNKLILWSLVIIKERFFQFIPLFDGMNVSLLPGRGFFFQKTFFEATRVKLSILGPHKPKKMTIEIDSRLSGHNDRLIGFYVHSTRSKKNRNLCTLKRKKMKRNTFFMSTLAMFRDSCTRFKGNTSYHNMLTLFTVVRQEVICFQILYKYQFEQLVTSQKI